MPVSEVPVAPMLQPVPSFSALSPLLYNFSFFVYELYYPLDWSNCFDLKMQKTKKKVDPVVSKHGDVYYLEGHEAYKYYFSGA